MKPENWARYVRRVAGDTSRKDLAAMCGVTESTLSRWLNGRGDTAADSVIDFARRMKVNPIEALIEADYLTIAEVSNSVEVIAARPWTDAELLAELAGRLALRPLSPESDDITPRMALPADYFGEHGEDGQRVG